MTVSPKGLDFIKSNEGCVLHPYFDEASVPTIGWGNTTYPNGRHVTMQDPPIEQGYADGMLRGTVSQVSEAVSAMVYTSLNQNQFDSLVDFAYNAGTGALHGSTALRLVNVNPNDPAIRVALAMWNKVHVDGVLKVSDNLTLRRAREADLYFQ